MPRSSPRPFPRALLVTGGAGFLGSRIVHGALDRGARVVVADDLSSGRLDRLPEGDARLEVRVADVAAPGVLTGLLAHEPFDAVLHLAGRVGVRRVLEDPEGCRREHLSAARELLRALVALSPSARPRLFSASTSEVYLEKRGPLSERDPVRPVDAAGRWAYAASKLAVEKLLDAAAGLWTHHRGPVHLRLFNVVGPGQDAGSGMVLATFVERALAGRSLPVHGDGGQVRTFAHVDDVAEDVLDLVGRRALSGGPINLGGRARTTVLELAREVARASGLGEDRIRFVDPRERLSAAFEEVRHREPSLGRARALGLGERGRGVGEIVRDTLARHAASGILGRACASPAS